MENSTGPAGGAFTVPGGPDGDGLEPRVRGVTGEIELGTGATAA